MPGKIGGREQEIADFVLDPLGLSPGDRIGNFGDLLVDLVDDLGGLGPVESDRRGFAGQFLGAGEGRQRLGDPVEQARPHRRHVAACPGTRAPLGRLDRFPHPLHLVRRQVACLAEHVRMAADQLGRDGLDHVAEDEGAGLLGHAGVEHDLQQQVAELVPEVLEVAALDGVGNLVGLLDRVGRDRPERLLKVPRTSAARPSEGRHDVDQALDLAGRDHADSEHAQAIALARAPRPEDTAPLSGTSDRFRRRRFLRAARRHARIEPGRTRRLGERAGHSGVRQLARHIGRESR